MVLLVPCSSDTEGQTNRRRVGSAETDILNDVPKTEMGRKCS